MNTEKSAYITSGVIVAILAAGGGYYAVQQNNQASVEEPAPISQTVKEESLSADEVASIGQQYVEDLAFMLGQPDDMPVLLKSTEEIDHDTWLVKYFVNVQALPVYSYHIDVEIMFGHVTDHSIQVIERDKNILVSEPEPSELISAQQFVVKGETKEPTLVTIELSNNESVIAEYTVDQTLTGTTVFAQNFKTAGIEPGEYMIRARTEDTHFVTLPVVISRSSL